MAAPNAPRSLAALFPVLHRLPEPMQDAVALVLLAMILIPGLASSARIAADIWEGEREPHDFPGSPVKALEKTSEEWLPLITGESPVVAEDEEIPEEN